MRITDFVGFMIPLIVVVVAGAELFTGNVLIVMAWASRRPTTPWRGMTSSRPPTKAWPGISVPRSSCLPLGWAP